MGPLTRVLRRVMVTLGLRKPAPAYLMKGEVPEPVQPPPRPIPPLADQLRKAARDARVRGEYEKEFPYEEPPRPLPDVARVSRRGPTVSGGLPSLNKRRR